MKSILIGLTVTLWIVWSTGYTQTTRNAIPQTDSVYCLPLWRARLLVADALRLRLADSLQLVTEERLEMVTGQMKVSHASFTNLLKIEQDRYTLQKENTGHMERLALSYKSERDYYQKAAKKQRRKKNVLGGALVVVIILSILK